MVLVILIYYFSSQVNLRRLVHLNLSLALPLSSYLDSEGLIKIFRTNIITLSILLNPLR